MDSGDYLEKVDNGETVTVNDVYMSGDYEALVDMFENATVSGGQLEVDPNYANDVMYTDDFDPLEGVENLVSTVLENQYDQGYQKADKKMQELNNRLSWDKVRDRALDRANKSDLKVKASDAGIGLSMLGFGAGAGTGSVHLMGGSAALGVLSANRNATWQGMEDRELKEAAEGLNKGYAGHEIDIS